QRRRLLSTAGAKGVRGSWGQCAYLHPVTDRSGRSRLQHRPPVPLTLWVSRGPTVRRHQAPSTPVPRGAAGHDCRQCLDRDREQRVGDAAHSAASVHTSCRRGTHQLDYRWRKILRHRFAILHTHPRLGLAAGCRRQRSPGRSFAVVPVDAEGVELEDDWDGFGQKLTATGTARFRNVSVDSIAVLPRTPGSAEAVHEAAFFQEVLLAVLAGIARAVRDDAAAGVRVRKRTFNTGLGLPYRQDPLIQETVGRIAATAFSVEATTCMLLPPWTAHLMP